MSSSDAPTTTCQLRILATSDLHAHLAPYDYFADTPSDRVGLLRVASLIRAQRATAKNVLLLDNGDLIQGTPLGDRAAETDIPHPMILAMNALGYDAATVGNHEFNYGLPFLRGIIRQADFPFTVANVAPVTGAPLTPPYVILDRAVVDDNGDAQTVKVGVVGFTPPHIMTWDRGHLLGKITAEDIVETAHRVVPQIKQAGADIIVALCHSGISDLPYETGMENAAAHLATVSGLDALVTGHTHLTFPGAKFAMTEGADVADGTLHGVPTVMSGLWGSHLGVIDLTLAKTETGWTRRAHQVSLPSIYARNAEGTVSATVPDAADIADIAQAAHTDTLHYIRGVVGHTSAPLQSYFSLVRPDATVQTVAEAQRAFLQTVLADTPHADLPILSAAAPFKAGARGGSTYYTDIPQGPLATKDIASLYLYPNLLFGVRATGAEIFEWLERAAGLFNQIAQGAIDAPLHDPEFPTYNFDMLLGLTYDIDITVPPRFCNQGMLLNPTARRISNVHHNGKLVTEDMEFVVATNNYRAEGAGKFPLTFAHPPIYEGSETCRDIVAAYITQSDTFTPTITPTWRIRPIGDTTVTFDTGMGALNHLDQNGNGRISDTGLRENGFARLRLTL